MSGRLEGQVALITGGAAGLGRDIARRFIAEGAGVAVVDRSPDNLASFEDEFGSEALALRGDVTSYGDIAAAVADTVERFGSLDTLVSNAGIWDFMTSLADLPEGEQLEKAVDEVLGVNVKGYLLAAKAALPALARSSGSIIFTLSNAAFYVAGGGPLYTAAKHAGVGIVRQLAYELAPRVRVNAVAPGAMSTDLRGPASLDMMGQSISDVPLADFVPKVVPLGTMPGPEAYTSAFVLLASREEGAAMTAAIIEAHGGMGVRGFPEAAGGNALADRYADE